MTVTPWYDIRTGRARLALLPVLALLLGAVFLLLAHPAAAQTGSGYMSVDGISPMGPGRMKINEGESLTYGIAISEPPTEELGISPRAHNAHDGLLTIHNGVTWEAQSVLSTDWMNLKSVRLTAVNDNVCKSPPARRFFIKHHGSGGGPAYAPKPGCSSGCGWNNQTRHHGVVISIQIIDDDCRYLTSDSPSSGSVSLDEGGSATYTVRLKMPLEDTAYISPRISAAGDSDIDAITVSPQRIRVEAGDTSPKTVTVSARRDADSRDAVLYVDHSVDSPDIPADYLGARVTVVVTDDQNQEPAREELTVTGLALTAGSETVALVPAFAPGVTSYRASVPAGTAGVTLAPHWSGEGSVFAGSRRGGTSFTRPTRVRPSGTAVALALAPDGGATELWVMPGGASAGTTTYRIDVTEEKPQTVAVAFSNVPPEHDGRTPFALDVQSGSRPAPEAFRVTAGKVTGVESLDPVLWRVRIAPKSWKNVTVALGEASATVGGPVRIRVGDARAKEGKDASLDFAVTLHRAAAHEVSVDYTTADGSGKAGEDYTAVSGTLSFAAGETEKTVHVPILDDDIDEGSEKFELRLSNESGAYVRNRHRKATGTIKNTDLIPAALLARFGRATAEQVVTHIEERMAAPRRRGFRARFAGRELRPGQERDFALGLASQFAQPMGMGPAGAPPMGMGSHAAGGGAFGVSTPGMSGMGAAGGAMGMGGMPGAMGMTGQHAPMSGYGPAGAAHGGGLLGSMGMGGDLFSNSELELNRESRGGMLSVWSRSSRSYFSGLENALSLDGDVRTTMFGADYSRGALTLGLSVGRTLGMGGFRRDANGGQMTTSMTGFYPWVGYQVNDRVSVWGVSGYGAGSLSLTPAGRSPLETGVSMAMSAVGTRGELIGARATGGFALAFKADALWVGAASDLVDGAMGRLNASDAGVTRVRTALEGSRGYTLAGGRLSLTPSVEVGLRRDGGDAETGAGMDVGGGLAFTDAVTGLSLDVRMRTLVVHQAEGFSERGMSLSFGWDPTPSSPLGLTAQVAPSWGGSAQGGAETLWNNQMAYGMGSHQMYGAGGQLNAEVGYGLPLGARLVGTPRVGLTTSQYGRDYRVGYALGVLDRSDVNFELGIDAERREMSMQGEANNGVMGRGTLGW